MNEPFNRRRARPCAYFQQGKCNRPQCNFSHDLSNGTADSMSSHTPSVNTPASGPSRASSDDSYPRSAYKTKPCRFYARGKCTAGDECRWSHDDNIDAQPEEVDPEFAPAGFKLVPKAYRTLPCARFLNGHCFYGDDCNFIHATPQSSAAQTPAAGSPSALGPPPPQILQKSHSTHHSPAISPLNAPAIRSSISADPPSATIGATLSAPTRPRELPPPQSQVHYSGVNWSLPAVATPGTPSKGGISTPPIFASSPLISGATEWSHPPSRSNSLQPPAEASNPNGAGRSPYLLTFGEIGPGGINSATNSPRGLGLNGASLATPSGVTNGVLPPGLTAPSSAGRIGSPAFGSGSALGTTGIVMGRQKSRLSTSNDVDDEETAVDADLETEPDFPSISYSDLNDLVTEPDDTTRHDDEMLFGNGINGDYHGTNGFGHGPSPGASRMGSFNGHMNGLGDPGFGNDLNSGAYENDWGHALNMLNNGNSSNGYGHRNGHSRQFSTGYSDQYRPSYKSRPCKYYVIGSRCPSGQNCTFIHDPQAMQRGNPTYSPPERMGTQHPLYRTRECKYHLAGRCHQEETCDFKHTGPPGQGREYENWEGFSIKVREHEVPADDRAAFRSRPCKWFLKGNCFHGDQCSYSHDFNPVARTPCHFFRNGTGHCIAGDTCRFSHEIVSPEDDAYYASVDDHDTQYPTQGPNGDNSAVPKVVSTVYDSPEENHSVGHYNEPYFGGALSGALNGDALTVQGPRMELVVSEGEDEEDDDDIIVLKPSPSPRTDLNSQDVEKLFASFSIATSS